MTKKLQKLQISVLDGTFDTKNAWFEHTKHNLIEFVQLCSGYGICEYDHILR